MGNGSKAAELVLFDVESECVFCIFAFELLSVISSTVTQRIKMYLIGAGLHRMPLLVSGIIHMLLCG